jgi:cobaltochelatase CobN
MIRRLLALTLLLLLGAACARAQSVEVSLLLGDIDSMTAIEAARQLRADPTLRGVRIHVYPSNEIRSRDLSGLERSRVVLVQTVGWTLAKAIAPELAKLRARGGRAFAVGSTWDNDIQALGFERDESLRAYMAAGGPGNVANMVRAALVKTGAWSGTVPPPQPLPELGALDVVTGQISASFDEYRRRYARYRPGRPWIGLAFYRANAVSGQTTTLSELAIALEGRGFNVIAFFGYPPEAALERFGFDRDGRPALAAIGALSLKIGNNPRTLVPVLERLDAPVLNLITLSTQSRAQWEASPQGLDIMERAWQVAMAEYGGLVAPTVVASKERFVDPATGLEGLRETPIPERVARAADRLARWVELRQLRPADKRVAVIYYNYPPGKGNIGASYLNVLPRSLFNIVERLKAEGYRTDGAPPTEEALLVAIRDRGGNIGNWNPGVLEQRVRDGLREGTVQLLPVATYRRWLERDVPAALRRQMIEKWGEPEASDILVWRDAKGTPYFVFPAQRYGNVLLAPQPTRGWEQDVQKLYHEVSLPPHHQYLAFYLWLQKEWRAHAMVHVGTHATHEWHSGKEVGYTAADPGELFVGAVPQLYPYIVDDIGEGLQAKRRGMATIISHMTPPLDKASLNPELKQLVGAISDYKIAKEKSAATPAAMRADIAALARSQGLLKDLGIQEVDDAAVEAIEHHIKDIEEKRSPFGLHTFGAAPAPEMRLATAEAVLSIESDIDEATRARRTAELVAAIERSAQAELDALVAGLAGRYVAAGPGNDPVRNPDSLPTGRNFYGFDPSRMPTRATWALGEKLATDLVNDFRRRKGDWPRRLVFNLWGVESNRHEGVMEAQILALMGIRPVWNARGTVVGMEPIARAELGRPRVDVTIIPSGLYRDLFAQVMKRLDEAVTLARAQPEEDNRIRQHMAATTAELVARGVAPERAEQLAGVRLFSVPSGAYGTNLDKVIPLSNTWDKGKEGEAKVASVYFMRMHHAFGQGLWGERAADVPGLAVDLFKGALRGAQGVIHSRSSNVYATLDNDDFYQYLGGTAMAIRQVNGSTPEVLVTNMSNPRRPQTETLEKYMGRELRARYLNPKWIEKMLAEGYAGARFASQVVEHLWGWTVTVPEAVGDEKWQQMYETWVADRHGLGIRDRFRAAGNLLAYQALVDRMLVAVNKGYWQADAQTVATLERVNRDVIAEAGVACWRDTCSSPEIVALAQAQDQRAMAAAMNQPAPSQQAVRANVASGRNPAAAPAPSAAAAAPGAPAARAAPAAPAAEASSLAPAPAAQAQVSGFEMERRTAVAAAVIQTSAWLIVGLALLVAGGGFLWRLRGDRDGGPLPA